MSRSETAYPIDQEKRNNISLSSILSVLTRGNYQLSINERTIKVESLSIHGEKSGCLRSSPLGWDGEVSRS
ncbi:hypothetical protein ACP6PL_18995 [Dapis sp. BLCC M126]|uniref:hypothetical protein n=1 Tax=Dapis sp. BLCC M126 TaxID=3400189 RepID=UPI003CE6D3C9